MIDTVVKRQRSGSGSDREGQLKAAVGRATRSPMIRDVVSIAVMLAAILSVYYPVVFGFKSLVTDAPLPKGPLYVGDPMAGGPITYGKLLAVMQSWSHLHLPIWLPTEGYGITLGGNQAAPWFFPEELLRALCPHNPSLWNVAALGLAALGAYILARELGAGRIGAMASGVVFSLSGPMIANINLDMINPLAVMPFVIWSGKRFIDARASAKKSWPWFVASTFTISQLFLAGFAEVLPLELITVGIYLLIRILTVSAGARDRIKLAGSWILSLLAGIGSALIAIVTLLQPLGSYSVLQSGRSYIHHYAGFWLISLFDPWTFGKGLTSGSLNPGVTDWSPGNIVIFALFGVGVFSLFRLEKGWQRRWMVASVALVGFGLLGFADELSVLNIFALPPFNLIAMVRFLQYLWWLPLSLVVGQAVTLMARNRVSRTILGAGLLGSFGALASLWIYIFVVGAGKFKAVSSANVGSTIRTNFPLVVFPLVACLVLLLFRGRIRALLALASLLALTLYVVPRNFFPANQAPSMAQSVKAALDRAGLADSLAFAPDNLYLPSALVADGIPEIQSFDVFFPKGYSSTLIHWFGDAPTKDPSSPLFPFAPTMYRVSAGPYSLGPLRAIGVETVVLSRPLAKADFSELPVAAPEPPDIGVSALRYRAAMTALLSVYKSRGDLLEAFPVATDSSAMITWALSSQRAGDVDAKLLAPYLSVYQAIHSYQSKAPTFKPIVAKAISNPISYVGSATFDGSKVYIYQIGGSANKGPVWIPRDVRIMPKGFSGVVPLNEPVASLPYGTSYSLNQQAALKITNVKLSENTDSAILDFNSSGRGLIAIRRQVAPGETLTVNGARAKLIKVDNFLTGVEVSPGRNVVRVDYVGSSVSIIFWVDLALNGAMAAIIIACLFGMAKRRLTA